MTYYGNQFPGHVFIDAKPIPGTDKIVYAELPGHGMEDHAATIMVLDPKHGPDDRAASTPLDLGPAVSPQNYCMDPYPVSKECYLFAWGFSTTEQNLYVTDGKGYTQLLYSLPQGSHPNLRIQEPRPIGPRKREPVIPSRVDLSQATGRLALVDITHGRNMAGVKPGEIKKLLVLEQLPEPINTIPISLNGTFTLKRVLGTVPVEPDGSAYMELPAMRSLFFVALDENNLSVKRMQSFVTVQPGEFTSCAGCHENRTDTPATLGAQAVLAVRRPASKITPLPGIPQIYDYPRDVQPILDKHCVACHDYAATEKGGPYSGGVILTADQSFIYSHSFHNLMLYGQYSDARNEGGNRPPRSIGTSASPLMAKISGGHHGVKLSAHETDLIRYWIEAGANYAGSYAAAVRYPGNGLLQQHLKMKMAYCGGCHTADSKALALPIFNLTRPEKSLALLAPLSRVAGGWGLCRDRTGKAVFPGKDDARYREIADSIRWAAGKRRPMYPPRPIYFDALKMYGLLPEDFDPQTQTYDVYQLDERYFRSFWYQPVRTETSLK
jgi:hypothetical protein